MSTDRTATASLKPELITIARAARDLGVPARRIRAAARRGQIPAYAVGAWLRVRAPEVRAWIETCAVRAERTEVGVVGDCALLRDLIRRVEQALEGRGGLHGEVAHEHRVLGEVLDLLQDALDRLAPGLRP